MAELRTAIPAAATARLRDLLAGPVAPGRVLHAGADAVYVDLGARCLGVLSRHAVHVPCGLRTALDRLPALPRSAPVRAGDGSLVVGPMVVRVGRLVDATLPAVPDPAAALSALRSAPAGQAVADELTGRTLAALRAGRPAVVVELLGRGSGLTPLGDDLLAGWLATARLLADPAYGPVAAEVDRLAPARTTRLSAELLDCALAGEVLPQFRRLVAALASGTAVTPVIAALVAVGHTSGAGLLVGCRTALEGAVVRGLGAVA